MQEMYIYQYLKILLYLIIWPLEYYVGVNNLIISSIELYITLNIELFTFCEINGEIWEHK